MCLSRLSTRVSEQCYLLLMQSDSTDQVTAGLAKSLASLTDSQLFWVNSVIAQFQLPFNFDSDPKSEWLTKDVVDRFGDALRIHHAFSRQSLSKDRFEFAFERALSLSGIPSALVTSRTNRGHDLTISGVPVSLKTEGAKTIKLNEVHISKWMELGKGEWKLETLRDVFLEHMKSYERILVLRCLIPGPEEYTYELVEIPKQLMLEAQQAELKTQDTSMQSPKPGYGYVRHSDGSLKYSLYFDGGTERKLQVKAIQKQYCRVHATWKFSSLKL